MNNQIRVNIETFRAIRKAEIEINGITLIAGENGSGKSTIAKLLYHIYWHLSSFEELPKKELIENLSDIIRFLEILETGLGIGIKTTDKKLSQEIKKEIRTLTKIIYSTDNIEKTEIQWITLIEKIQYLLSRNDEISIADNTSANFNNRLTRILSNILETSSSNISLNEEFEKIKIKISQFFNEAKWKIINRPTKLLLNEISKIFGSSILPEKLEILEFDDKIFSIEKQKLSIPFLINKAFYIDTPFVINSENEAFSHWENLNLELRNGKSQIHPISKVISDEIIEGESSFNDDVFSIGTDFKFSRKDGEIYNLLDVATGVKSFSILQLLLNSGQLDNKTLLIIDEPESHLHPQWIVEYARIIVQLNKDLGVKFLLASHSPEFVGAIKYISEKQQISNNVNFYVAKRVDKTFAFDFVNIGNEIEPIFASFNKSLDKINNYGI